MYPADYLNLLPDMVQNMGSFYLPHFSHRGQYNPAFFLLSKDNPFHFLLLRQMATFRYNRYT